MFDRIINESIECAPGLVEALDEFKTYIKSFVFENIDQFMDSNVEETVKNIHVFSETAAVQFLHEMTSLMGFNLSKEAEQIEENTVTVGNYI
jgi:hypothetical protein